MRIETGEWTLPSDAVLPGVGVRGALLSARRELWRSFPAWMYCIYGIALLNTELTNLSPARTDLAWTVVFPLGVFLVFTATRATLAAGVHRRWQMLLVSAVLALGLPVALSTWHRPSPLSIDALRTVYELSNFGWAALLVFHAWKHQRTWAWLFFGVGLFYGFVLENGGIVMGFFHETNLQLTVVHPLKAPFATVLGWSVVMYLATFVVWQLRATVPGLARSAVASAALVAVAATMLDLQIDPLATAAGCWVWDQSLPAWFEGVPRVNFIAWLCAIFPFSLMVFRYQALHGLKDRGAWASVHLWKLTARVPAALLLAAALFVGVTLLVEGTGGPAWTLLYGFTARLVSAMTG